MLEILDHHPEIRVCHNLIKICAWWWFDWRLLTSDLHNLPRWKPQRFSKRFSVAALLLSRVMFSPLLFVISMDSGDVRIEDLDATSTTLIMRGLNRQTTREMLQTLLRLGFLMWTWAVGPVDLGHLFFLIKDYTAHTQPLRLFTMNQSI